MSCLGAITVQLHPNDEDLVCTVEISVGEIPTIQWVKEALCKQDPTGGVSPADFRLSAATLPGAVLDDAVVVTPALGTLVLCSEGEGELEETAELVDLVPSSSAGEQADSGALACPSDPPRCTDPAVPGASAEPSDPAGPTPPAGPRNDPAGPVPVVPNSFAGSSVPPVVSGWHAFLGADDLGCEAAVDRPPSPGEQPPQAGSAAAPAAPKAAARSMVWVVVGGADKGGILVKAGQALDSERLPTRLSTGASVRQEELVGDRLRFTLLSGTGPSTGWVSTRIEGKVLLVPQRAWRLFAVSDLHVDYKENEEWVTGLPETGHEHDAVILAGDISHRVDLVRWTIKEFSRRFAYVFYCTGNHELWVTRPDAKVDGNREFEDSLDKFGHLRQVAREAGALVDPTRLGSGVNALWIVPLQSWYESDFGNPGDVIKQQARKVVTDFRECVWPEDVGSTSDDAARYFDSLNKEAPGGGYDAPVVTFSHFLPRLELLPYQLPADYRLLRAAVGTKNLEERVRSLGSKLHVFGHSHVNWYTHWHGIHYVQNALRYPKERKAAPTRVDVTFNDSNLDPMKPFLVWKSDDPTNFCLQPERCGRGCPRALASSVNFKNEDSTSAAASWEKSITVESVEGLGVSEGLLEDLPEVTAHLLSAVNPKTGGDFIATMWPLWIKHPLCHILVAKTLPGERKQWGCGIAGTATLQKLNAEEGWVMGLRVREAARRDGVAKLLLREMDRVAAAVKGGALNRLRLSVSSGNDAMLGLCSGLKLEVDGRFAFVECLSRPGPVASPKLVPISTAEAMEFDLRVGGMLHNASGGLYQQSLGVFQHLYEGKLKTHERLGHLAGWRANAAGHLQGIIILVPEHDGRSRIVSFAAAESDSALVSLLKCAWDFELKACEAASPISGYLPVSSCKPIERGDVPGWTRPRSTEELVFGWTVGYFRKKAAKR